MRVACRAPARHQRERGGMWKQGARNGGRCHARLRSVGGGKGVSTPSTREGASACRSTPCCSQGDEGTAGPHIVRAALQVPAAAASAAGAAVQPQEESRHGAAVQLQLDQRARSKAAGASRACRRPLQRWRPASMMAPWRAGERPGHQPQQRRREDPAFAAAAHAGAAWARWAALRRAGQRILEQLGGRVGAAALQEHEGGLAPRSATQRTGHANSCSFVAEGMREQHGDAGGALELPARPCQGQQSSQRMHAVADCAWSS